MQHIMECIPLFQVLNQRLENIKQEVVKNTGLDYRSQDARLVALDSIQMNMAATAMWINGLNSLANFCTADGIFNENQFLNSVGSGLELIKTEEEMFRVLKLGHITLIHFKIENLFRNLCAHLNLITRGKSGFWDLTNLIFDACSIEDGNSKNSLIAFAHIRNSLHNNGIHRNKSAEFFIDGYHYKFVKGQPINNCVSWERILSLLTFNVVALREILLSEKIQKINELVLDQFALRFS
ncbi:hypothetical protein LHV13_06325 [Ferrovum sp. PN-J185]|uniref:hypothetical protein n=1 Tax=Ferrovum sp. PN-J185 TaxID=1356306 RepID=UPI001E35B52A|nr:hypothetical protein [Ferrovum sp. PN-J185]MCC6068785.1 hypothetical protein [Ferrovum sp. PN-J185]